MLLTVVALGLGGCISAHKLDQAIAVPVGMNKVQVVNKLGEPPLRDRLDDGTERWIWSRDGQFGHESVTLLMKDERVAAIETEGERLKHLEEMERLRQIEERLQGTTISPSAAAKGRPAEREILVFKPVAPSSIPPSNVTNSPPVAVVAPAVNEEGLEDEQAQRQAFAEAQRQRNLEEQARALDEEKTRAEAAKPAEDQKEPKDSKAKAQETAHDVPPFTAWYMARQMVNDHLVEEKRLAGKRRLFPNPRFARDSTGEERLTGNNWRAWGYVDTVDDSNAPIRYQWTAELEFQGGTKWHLKDLAVGGKK
jgi:hypothetical protein